MSTALEYIVAVPVKFFIVPLHVLTREMFGKKQDLSLLFSGFPICEKETVLNTKTKINSKIKIDLKLDEFFQMSLAITTMSLHHQGGRKIKIPGTFFID